MQSVAPGSSNSWLIERLGKAMALALASRGIDVVLAGVASAKELGTGQDLYSFSLTPVQ
jgi:hypothetical protein